MSDDIVTRLRVNAEESLVARHGAVMVDAAVEIARLRALVASKDVLVSQLRDELKQVSDDR